MRLTDALNDVLGAADTADEEAIALVDDFMVNLLSGGKLSNRQWQINGDGIELQFAVLYQGGHYEEKVYRVLGTHADMPYAQLNEIGQRYVNALEENDNIFGCYLTGIPEA